MGIRQTDTVQANLEFLTAKRLAVLAERPDAKLALEAASFCRQAGCGELLSRMNTRAFFEALAQSARIYLDLLERRQECSERDAYYLARSKAAPFFDALAAQEKELVARMLPLLTRDWMPRMEPEELFHYHMAISCLVGDSGDLEGALRSFERALEGGESVRFDVTRALVARDSGAFDVALQSLIDERCMALAKDRKAGIFDPYFHQTEAHVFVEGLALIRVAQERGMGVRRWYRTIPEPTIGAVSHAR